MENEWCANKTPVPARKIIRATALHSNIRLYTGPPLGHRECPNHRRAAQHGSSFADSRQRFNSAAEIEFLSRPSELSFDHPDKFTKIIGHFPPRIPCKRKRNFIGASLIQGDKLVVVDQGFCDFFRKNSKAETELQQPNESDVLADAKPGSLEAIQQIESPQVIDAGRV